MAPRANWKGFLRLSLVTCPVALYPATSESEKISFNQLNRATGHRIKYLKVDADIGTYRTYPAKLTMSVDRGKADLALGRIEVRV
jgi:non-homologous end joining protein Ku